MKIINKSLLIALIALLSATNIYAMEAESESQSRSFEEMILRTTEACFEPNNIKESDQTFSQIAQTCKKLKLIVSGLLLTIVSGLLLTTEEIKNDTTRDKSCFIQLYMGNFAHLLAATGNSKTLHILLKNFSELVNSYTAENSNTPLHIAAVFGHANCVTTLLEHRANVNARNGRGQTPLECAKEKEIINTIKKYGGFKESGIRNIDKQLIEAAKYGKTETIEKLLKTDANINAQDTFGKTALIYTAQRSRIDIVKSLIKHGANINAKNILGSTALMYATHHGDTDTVELLLKHGANINAKDTLGKTALIEAVHYSHTDIIKLLLEAGANANVQDNNGKTALDIAQQKKHTEIVKLLKEN